jgi:hypothetical protein
MHADLDETRLAQPLVTAAAPRGTAFRAPKTRQDSYFDSAMISRHVAPQRELRFELRDPGPPSLLGQPGAPTPTRARASGAEAVVLVNALLAAKLAWRAKLTRRRENPSERVRVASDRVLGAGAVAAHFTRGGNGTSSSSVSCDSNCASDTEACEIQELSYKFSGFKR